MADMLDLAQLRTFVAIDACGGFGRAAAALHVSQPTVSQHVRLLETRIGRPLVERVGRRSRFTAAGERLLVEARRILAVHDEAVERLDAASTGTLVVGSTETAAEQVLPGLLRHVRAAFPDVAVQFRVDRSAPLAELVGKGEVDLAVVLDPGSDIPGTLVGTLPLHWYAAPGWTPPEAGAPVPLVGYVEPCGMRRRALQELVAAGLRAEIAAESTSLEGVLGAARAGLGVAVLPNAGEPPAGLERRLGLPDVGDIAVRLMTRRGLHRDVEETAVHAVRGFFATRPRRAVSALSA